MPILIESTESTGKRWSPTITTNASGLHVDAFSALIGNANGWTDFAVPAIDVVCTSPGAYRLVLCRTQDGASLVLERDGKRPDGYAEALYLARWTLRDGETCADVDVEVTRRVLVPRPPTIADVPVYEDQVDEETGEIRRVQVGTEQITIPPEPLPDPTRHVVSPVLVLPTPPTLAERLAAIDARTDARIAEGFVFRGLRFSTSIEAQTRSLGCYGTRDLPQYPIRWNSLDDGESTTLSNAEDMTAFHFAGVSFIRACVDAGTVEKDAVRAEVAS